MKKLYTLCLTLLAASFLLTACSEQDPFHTATPDHTPRNHAPNFPDRSGNALAVFSTIDRDGSLKMNLVVTPADYTTVTWLIDGQEVAQGTSIDLPLQAGTFTLKLIAATEAGKSTSREGLVVVKPLAADPWATTVAYERILSPGRHACLYGDNLSQVKAIRVGGQEAEATFNAAEGTLCYTVPSGLSDGEYRIELVGLDGTLYGGDKVTVSHAVLVTSGADRVTAGTLWTLTGINMEQIASVEVGGQSVSSFTQQNETQISFPCPELPEGETILRAKSKSGEAVSFYTAQGIVTEKSVVISLERTLWSGHHYVSWDLPDGDPNKTFNLIGQDVFAGLAAGSVLNIHYTVAPEAAYHQLRTTTAEWTDLPGTSTLEFSTDGVHSIVLTADALDLIQQQSGFLCVGHGYYVDLVTVK